MYQIRQRRKRKEKREEFTQRRGRGTPNHAHKRRDGKQRGGGSPLSRRDFPLLDRRETAGTAATRSLRRTAPWCLTSRSKDLAPDVSTTSFRPLVYRTLPGKHTRSSVPFLSTPDRGRAVTAASFFALSSRTSRYKLLFLLSLSLSPSPPARSAPLSRTPTYEQGRISPMTIRLLFSVFLTSR